MVQSVTLAVELNIPLPGNPYPPTISVQFATDVHKDPAVCVMPVGHDTGSVLALYVPTTGV
jgi:hypothetical protein